MSDAAVTSASPAALASGFAPATRDDWLALVDKAIKGADFEKKLVSQSADGLRVEPIYRRGDAVDAAAPGSAPYSRGTRAEVAGLGWEVHQVVRAASPSKVNAEVLEELEGGANGVVLEIEAPGQSGIAIRSREDVVSALRGMRLDLAPVQLCAGLGAADAARHLLAALPELAGEGGTPQVFLNLDPIGTLARFGSLGEPVQEAIAEAMAIARQARQGSGPIRTVRVDACPYHEAGASEAQELAALAATLVAYLRTFEAAGIAPAAAADHLSFAVAAHSEQFLTIAKLRAARRLIWRVLEAAGGGGRARAMHITAVSSGRMMARRDAWTNLLRTTLACAGAALGGADAIVVRPFTWALGEPDVFTRRTARNIQIVLQEESGLGRVVDPAGGSWYVERLSADLAAKSWELFQAIEARGGIIASLGSGALQDEIAAKAAARAQALATGRASLTGVSAFPRLGDDGIAVEPRRPDPDVPFKPVLRALTPLREAAPFEALRDAADGYVAEGGKPPAVFLASIGSVIDHTVRSTWIKNYLAAGGIEALTSDGYPHAEAAAHAFKVSGANVACICSSDALNAQHAVATAKALKSAGARLVLMAGKPGEDEASLRAAGVDQFLFAGADAVATLTGLQEKLGVAA